jgi:hypothetical protein
LTDKATCVTQSIRQPTVRPTWMLGEFVLHGTTVVL